jgi:hypothetical protein
MPHYRLYRLNETGHVMEPPPIIAANDNAHANRMGNNDG